MKRLRLPSDINLAITYFCQCRCPTCDQYKYDQPDDARDELDFDGFRRVIDNILRHYPRRRLPRFTIDGGECFLKPFTLDLISELNRRSVRTIVNTNLGLPDRPVLDFLSEMEHVEICVSVDGVGTVHDGARRVDGLYDKVKKNIVYLYGKGKPVSVAFTASRLNYFNLEETFTDLEPYVSAFRVCPLNWHSREIIERNAELTERLELDDEYVRVPNLSLENEDQVEVVRKALVKLWRRSKIFYPGSFWVGLSDHFLTSEPPPGGMCRMFDSLLRIHPDGRACNCFFDGPSVEKEGLEAALRFEGRDIVRGHMLKGVVFPKCYRCCMHQPGSSLKRAVYGAVRARISEGTLNRIKVRFVDRVLKRRI